jgi:hypothetical protein
MSNRQGIQTMNEMGNAENKIALEFMPNKTNWFEKQNVARSRFELLSPGFFSLSL